MVHQSPRFTKIFALLLLAGLLVGTPGGAHAIVKMDSKSIDTALIYGMQQRKMGLRNLLGSNWVEGERGALLNVYTPFMMIASKASKLKLSINPTEEDLKKAREKMGREVAFYRDAKNKQRMQVKFSVSFYGDTPVFHKTYKARIVGFGRGKEFEVTPRKTIYEEKSRQVSNSGEGAYEAINAYFFRLGDVEDLQEFRLILESPSGPPVVFRLNGERLY